MPRHSGSKCEDVIALLTKWSTPLQDQSFEGRGATSADDERGAVQEGDPISAASGRLHFSDLIEADDGRPVNAQELRVIETHLQIVERAVDEVGDRKSTRLNSSH